MITSYQEAQFLFSTCEEERCEQEIALQIAQARLNLAEQKFQDARRRLTKTEFRLGRIRYIIKKNGFSDIFQRRFYNVKRRPVVKIHRMYLPSYYLNPPHNPLRHWQPLNHT
jgi:AraC-like DNA-binding protein